MKSRSASATLAKLLAALLAFSLIAAACGGSDGDGATNTADDTTADDTASDTAADDTAADEPAGDAVVGTVEDAPVDEPEEVITPGGVLKVAVEAETDGLNPAVNRFAVSAYLMGLSMIEPVAAFDAEGNWFPYLAESFTPVEGTNSWQMKLREGVMFHNGEEVTADDAIANFEAQLGDLVISLAVAPSFPPENRIEKIDKYTVQYNLIRPSAHFPANLTSQLGMLAAGSWIAAATDDPSLNQAPVGTGPFMLESRTQDDRTIVVKNPNYWQGADKVYLDGIEFIVITDSAIAAERVAAGEIDVQITSSPDAILTLRDADTVSTIENLRSGVNDVMMNTRKPPFDDIRVRKALTYAADREGYSALITQGTSPLANTFFHPDLIWNNPDIVQEGNTPELAAPLVEAYCADVPENCTDGRVNMELQYSGPSVSQTRIADIFSAMWGDYFNITKQELLQDAHILDVATGAFDVVTWRQFGAADPDNEVVWLECATAEGFITINWVRVCNPDRDAKLFEQRATTDLDTRVGLWREVQQDVHDTYSYIFTTYANWTIGVSERVRNICGQRGPGDELMFCNNSGNQFFHNVWLAQ